MGGWRSIVGEPGTKGLGMLEPGTIYTGRVMSRQKNLDESLGKEVPDHAWVCPPYARFDVGLRVMLSARLEDEA